MAERRQLPVQDRDHSGLGWMDDHVVELVVAVHDRGRFVVRQVGGQPLHEPVHGRDLLGLGGHVLLRPAPDLAGEVIARLAEAAQAHGLVIDAVQARPSWAGPAGSR